MTEVAETRTGDPEVNVKQEEEEETVSSTPEPVKDDEGNTKDMEEKKEESAEEEEARKKREAELKEKYKDWPLRNIKEPHDNDVMYGRGGGTNHHPGNKLYRKMVEDRKLEYVNSKRLDKPLVALEIIRLWRGQLPPGRFLKLDEKTGLWNDVGDKKAREKTSQALREKAPIIRKQQEDDPEESEGKSEETKTTRFAEGTKEEDANQVKKAVLARDHSLGREYIEAGQAVSLDGFSWQDPFQSRQRESSYGRPAVPGTYPAGRNSSHGSLGMPPPHHTSGGPAPPPDFWGRRASSDRQHDFSNGRLESWEGSSYGYLGTPPPPPPPGHATHQRSGSWAHGPPPPPGGYVHRRSGSWGSGREHSLGIIPLIGASVAGPADRGTFDSGRSLGYGWGEPGSPPRPFVQGQPPPPPLAYRPGPIRSGGSFGAYRRPTSPANSTPSPRPYNVDLTIAKTWSGSEVQPAGWSGDHHQHTSRGDVLPSHVPGADRSPQRDSIGEEYVPKPQIVKRDTSHQNENYETKPLVKRAALNRDNSLASNRLKQEYMPELLEQAFDAEQEVRSLSTNFEQSTITNDRPKPKPLSNGERVSTIDVIAMDLIARPSPIMKDDRVSTIDALDLDLDGDSLIRLEQGAVGVEDLSRPKTLEAHDRLTTKDLVELAGDDPIPLDDGGRIDDVWLSAS